MISILEKDECCGCHACLNACKQNCISMVADTEGFSYPQIDMANCIDCGLCDKVCPILHVLHAEHPIQAYGCSNKELNVRLDSSSGGVFSLVAEGIIEDGGIVFGVGFDDAFHVCHSGAETKEALAVFRGSKYVQSEIGNTYKQAKELLDNGRQVLFSGTPCQIGGLIAYLGKHYDNLTCVDIICHGVPSPLVWQKYVHYREHMSGAKARRIAFRLKNEGWKLFSVSFSFENHTEYRKNLTKDLYMQGFLRNIYLRPSCYNCQFKTVSRRSDMTLADFWGIENIMPELDDDKGTSLVFLQSDKGRNLFNRVKDKMTYRETDVESAVRYNTAAIQSAAVNPKREKFFADMNRLPFDKVMKKYLSDSAWIIFKKQIFRVLSKIKRLLILVSHVRGKN